MKALLDAGIDEATLQIGDAIGWQGKDFGWPADVVAYIERDESGTITRIAFSGWKQIFTTRHKLIVSKSDYAREARTQAAREAGSMWEHPMVGVGNWYASAVRDGRIQPIAQSTRRVTD